MKYRIAEMTLDGFRGYRRATTVRLNKPLVILEGSNGSGKSSTANGPIFAIAGNDAARKDLGPVTIRERTKWQVKNRHAKDAAVRLTLADGAGARCIVARTGKTVTVDGKPGDPLAKLGVTMDTVVASIFNPQEAVRSIVVMEPRSRDALFTSLAGLDSVRRLEDALHVGQKSADALVESIARERRGIDDRIGAQVRIVQKQLQEREPKARNAGLSLDEAAVRQLANDVEAALRAFCESYGLERPTLPAGDLNEFVRAARAAIARLESANPLLQQQTALGGRLAELEGLLGDHERLAKQTADLAQQRVALQETNGLRGDVEAKRDRLHAEIEEADRQYAQAGSYHAMLGRALDYFQQLAGSRIACPLCRAQGVEIGHVREHLQSELHKAGLQPLQERLTDLRKEKLAAETVLWSFNELAQAEAAMSGRRAKLDERIIKAAGRSLAPTEDARRVLEALRDAAKAELAKVAGMLDERNKAIAAVRDRLEQAGLVSEILRLRELLERLDALPQSSEYAALKSVQSRAERLASLAAALVKGADAERRAGFDKAFSSNVMDVQANMARISARADLAGLTIDSTTWDVVVNGVPVTPTLNVGDVTAIALSLFCAMAKNAAHAAEFVILDDPSQNFDAGHKRGLAEVLADLARERQVIVTSTDSEFLDALKKAGTVQRQVVRFRPWDESRGIELEVGDAP